MSSAIRGPQRDRTAEGSGAPHQRAIELDGPCGVLRGTVYEPVTGPTAVAVLSHGFGGSRWEGGLFPQIARALAARGVRCLAVDRTGQGESDGDFFDVTVERDLADASAVLDLALAMGPVAGGAHLIGLSLGAVVSTFLAADRPGDVRTMSLMSTACSFADEIRSGSLQGQSLDALQERGYLDFYGRRLGPAIVESSVLIDPFARAAGYEGPVRLLHGDGDFIPVSSVERYLDVYGQRAFLTVRPGADHGWMTVPDREWAVRQIVSFVCSDGQGC